MSPGYPETAWAWVDHLRHGGTTPWRSWLRRGDVPPAADGTGPLPGAAELELVRLLALADRPAGLDFPALAEVVLRRSGPGRGRGQLPLPWPDASPGAVGPPATDPAAVPAGELLRVAAGALADLVLAAGPVPPPTVPRRRVLARRFRLVGAPVTAAAVRADLEAAGHAEGGHRPRVVVLAEPLDVQLGQVWSARVQRGSAVRWGTFVGRCVGRGTLPPSADPAAVAARWAAGVGPERVHVVVGRPADRGTAVRLLGLTAGAAAEPPRPRELAPEATDLLRRVNRVLAVRVHDEQVPGFTARLVQHLDEDDAPPLGVPVEHREWARALATGVAARLRSGGYAVHGDPGHVAPRPDAPGTHPHPREVLDLAVGALLALAPGTAP